MPLVSHRPSKTNISTCLNVNHPHLSPEELLGVFLTEGTLGSISFTAGDSVGFLLRRLKKTNKQTNKQKKTEFRLTQECFPIECPQTITIVIITANKNQEKNHKRRTLKLPETWENASKKSVGYFWYEERLLALYTLTTIYISFILFSIHFLHTVLYTFPPYCSLYISYSADEEKLSKK